MNIPTIIRNQINTMDRWAFGAWGAKDHMNMSKGISFKTSGMTHWKGTVTVMLDEGKDLYVVKFTRLRKLNVIVDKIVEDVFVDDLINVIDSQVR